MFALRLLAACIGVVCLQSQLAVSLEVENHLLDLVYSWNFFEYDYDNEEQREAVINKTGYVPEKNIPIDVDVSPEGKIFVTIIRDNGVPSSLNYVTKKNGKGGPLLRPYPNWDAAKTDCTGIFSVYRVDICKNILYVIDNGMNGDDHVCPARLYMYDLRTDTLVKNLTIPHDVAMNTTINRGSLLTPIVDCCSWNAGNVYIADTYGYAVLTYHRDTDKFCRITGEPLNYDANAETLTVNGQSFQLQDGPVGMALSCSSKKLYLSPLSSYDLVSIRQQELDNSCGDVPMQDYTNILPTQSAAKAWSSHGTLFFSLVNSTSIACWNEHRPLTENNMVIIAQDSERLQFVSGMKIRRRRTLFLYEEQLWALSNRFQKGATNTLNVTEVNFRILKKNVRSLTLGTRCGLPFWG